MMQEVKLNLTADALEKEDYDSISIALKKLTTASEEQFEDIKREKWYNRLFNMISFSKENEIRVAEQINTLAQAQQILFEILLRFASQSFEISEIIKKHSEYIENLSGQDIILAKRIKKLEDIRLGVKPKLEIESLTDKQKGILSALLYKLAKIYAPTSEAQQNFALNLEKYLGKDRMDNPEIAFLDMDEKSRAIILLYCMKYAFLNNYDDTSYEKIKEIIYASRVSQKDIDNLKEQISADYQRTGLEGFCNEFQPEDYELSEFFELEFEEEEYVEENITREDELITSIIEIPSGVTKIYKNKNIHISSIIHCSGKLVFDNCSVYYNESAANSNRIVMSSGAEITIKDSDIICKGYDEDYFINSNREGTLNIDNCEFYDCCFFSKTGTFTLKDCVINNSFCVLFYSYGKALINNNVFIQNKLSEMYIPHIKSSNYDYEALITTSVLRDEHSVFENNRVIQYDNYGGKEYEASKPIIYKGYATVNNSSFEGIKEAVQAKKFEKCTFKDCMGAIQFYAPHSEKNYVKNCNFINCKNVISDAYNANITHCQFVKCYDNIISTTYQGGVEIEFCEFRNIKVIDSNRRWWDFAIELNRYKGKDATRSEIRNCVFDGVELLNSFLIGTRKIEGKPKGYTAVISDCVFKNIITDLKSEIIIKEESSYDTLFEKDKVFKAVLISNCRGLDSVNKGTGVSENADVRTVTAENELIGPITELTKSHVGNTF